MFDIKWTVLGCEGPFPSAGGATSGYLLEIGTARGEKRFLVDCGSGIAARVQQYATFSELDGVIVTHMHYDHSGDLGVLSYGLSFSACRLPLYAPCEEGMYGGVFEYHRLTAETQIGEEDFQITFFPTVHPVECYGLKVQAGTSVLVYTSDTVLTDRLAEDCLGANTLIADGNFVTKKNPEAKGPHMTVSQCGALAEAIGAEQLLVTHLSPQIPLEMYEEETAEWGATVARPDMQLMINVK